MPEINNYVYIVRVVSPHGLDGEVKVRIITDNPGRFEAGRDVYLIGGGKISSSRIVNVKTQADFVILKLSGINDRETAGKFREYFLGIRKDQLEKLKEGVYYYFEIIGLAVYSVEGDFIGEVADIINTGGSDVYIARNKGEEVYIPAVKDVVEKIDLINKRVIVRHQAGLF